MRALLRGGACLLLLILLSPAAAALAKGPPDKVVISGPGLSGPLEIVDPALLNEFNPWLGVFVDPRHDLPPALPDASQSYRVQIFLKGEDGQLQPIYELSYAPDPAGGRGYTYLPGRRDPGYERNIETIIRDGEQGRWLRAGATWDAAMRSLLAQHVVASAAGFAAKDPQAAQLGRTSTAVSLAGTWLAAARQPLLWLGAALGAALLSAGALRLRRRHPG